MHTVYSLFSVYDNMAREHRRVVGSRKYKDYRAGQLDAALKDVRSGRMTLRKASKKYNIPLGTLSNKINGKFGKSVGRPLALSDNEERTLSQHLKTVAAWGFPIDIVTLRMLVRDFLDRQGKRVPQFKNNIPSSDWARLFLKRHADTIALRMCQNIKQARARVNAESVNSYFDNLEQSLKNEDGTHVPPSHIFNYDETNLSDDPGIKKCIFKRGVKYPERIKDSTKTSVSIMFCGSAAGEMLPAYVVYKAEHVWSTWTEGGPKNTRYNRSKSGWFDSHCFNDWFESIFIRGIKHLNGTKVLIGDNLSSHFSERVLTLARENDVRFICLLANSTHLLQPLDVAFYGPMKRHWRSILDDWKTKSSKKSCIMSKDAFPGLLKKLYSKLYDDDAQKSTNIISGFKKCGIYPIDRNVVLQRLPENENDEMDADDSVSEAVIDLLKTMRQGGEQKRQRRTRITVEPGKSISVEDIAEAGPSAVEEMSSSNENADETDSECYVTDGETSEEDDEVDEGPIVPVKGKFYVTKFTSKCTIKYFVGKCLSVDMEDDACEMTFMRCYRNKNKMVWPDNPDVGNISLDQLIKVLDAPVQERRGVLAFNGRQLGPCMKQLQ